MSTLKTRNAKFKKATKAEKRVLIAKDVLAQLALKKFRPKFGSFIKLKGKFDPETQLSEIFEDSAPKVNCAACALGSMMMAEIRHNNAVSAEAMQFDFRDENILIGQRNDKIDRLNHYFDEDQLMLIERAFECGEGYYGIGDGYDYKPSLSRPGQRMKAIMENIVKNGGKFIP